MADKTFSFHLNQRVDWIQPLYYCCRFHSAKARTTSKPTALFVSDDSSSSVRAAAVSGFECLLAAVCSFSTAGIIVYHAQHSEANLSRHAPPVPASSVTGIARRTDHAYLVANKTLLRRCRGIAVAAAPASVFALQGHLDLARAAGVDNSSYFV